MDTTKLIESILVNGHVSYFLDLKQFFGECSVCIFVHTWFTGTSMTKFPEDEIKNITCLYLVSEQIYPRR